ncbi:MAG: ABC transporter permease [Chloroflexi bacterium]|nr:ABC transporter permease [Chloroflexota bacterium]
MTAASVTAGGRRPGAIGGSPGEGGSRLGGIARAFWTSVRIGWRMEANWTDPLLFFIYSVAKPVSAALILVVMLSIVAGPAAANLRPFVVIGTALWSLVTSGISGLAWSILDDRERYRMLKYIYVSPADFVVVLLGRGVARLGVGAAGTIITIVIGILVLGVPFDLGRIDWPVLVLATLFGLTSVVALALLLAAICLQTRQESWSYPEAFAGAAFLVSGAVFPLTVLPAPVQVLGLVTPLGWWIEAARRAFLPDAPSGIGGAGSYLASINGGAVPSAAECLLALIVTGAVATLAAAVVFRFSVRRAQERGLLDLTTGS